jgi:hypothetical protein
MYIAGLFRKLLGAAWSPQDSPEQARSRPASTVAERTIGSAAVMVVRGAIMTALAQSLRPFFPHEASACP